MESTTYELMFYCCHSTQTLALLTTVARHPYIGGISSDMCYVHATLPLWIYIAYNEHNP